MSTTPIRQNPHILGRYLVISFARTASAREQKEELPMFKPFSASRSAPQLRNAFLCALLLLPFLAIFAPRASAQSYQSLPRVEVAAGPAVTEGEPATFHVRVRP
ncbi:MAG: hypothetical protein OXF66_08315, partial [Gammaproteobacteria bacterium]|nr:hypothetical protein [Gammaproteobacteria bacterium]MCY4166324.1 hypothetical protein [Gammaproteobacteria bacterium]MCY4254559.1 hypothetical protein [Gammaproteobacteria bacterium]MCY4340253.1 hypothetical protein [Gammaproteobacteria bacterium]